MPRFDVSPAAPHELLPACQLLFARYAGVERDRRATHCRDRLLSGGEPSGVFVARAAGRLCAASLVQSLPGALGVAWPSRGDSAEAEDAVTAAACAWLRERGVKVCQAFAATDERDDLAPLERHGFRHVTQLVLLRIAPSSEAGTAAPPTGRLTLVADGPRFSSEFERTLLATHEGTRDCPELNEPRTPADILAGFTSATYGEWYRAECDSEPIGVVLFEADPKQEAAEITYVGVIPKFRGRGFGSELLKSAVGGAALAGARALNVSVDARNTPAMKLYARHGFVEYARREVWLATWAT